MSVIINAITPIFLLIALGMAIKIILNLKCTHFPILAKTCKMHNDSWSEILNKYVLYIALPALLFFSLTHTSIAELPSLFIIFINIALLTLIIGVSFFITKKLKLKKDIANAYIFGIFFGNVAYIGLPFILSLLPNTAGELSILIAIHVIIAFTLGLFILEYSKNKHANLAKIIKSIATNPLIIAITLGILFLITGIKIPHQIDMAIQMLSSSASPIVLIAIGLFIAQKIDIDKYFWHGTLIALIKIIVMPTIFLIVAILLQQTNSFNISILEAAMPVALTTFALSEIYPINKKIIANAIIVSTATSVVTLTAFSFFVI